MKILKGTIFGGIATLVIGWIVFGMLLNNFLAANTNTSLNRPMDEIILWAIILSNLGLALIFTLILNWSGAKSVADGIKKGALFGLLFSITMDLGLYSMTTMYSLSYMIVDVIGMTILMAIVGLIIVLTWGKEKTT